MEHNSALSDLSVKSITDEMKSMKEKKIFIPMIGSLGDVKPLLILARQLKHQGHIVWVGVHKRFQNLARAFDVETTEIGGDMAITLSTTPNGIELCRSPSLFKISLIKQVFQPLIGEWLDGIASGIKDADLIVLTTCTVIVGLSCIEKFKNAKAVGVYIYPVEKTSAFAPPCLEQGSESMFNWINLLKWRICEWILFRMFQEKIDEFRASNNLPPVKFDYYKMTRSLFSKPMVTATIYSNHLLPRPSDWGENNLMVGAIIEEELSDFEPPTFIVEFFNKWKDERVVYVGVGSMMAMMLRTNEQIEFLRLLQTAIVSNGLRAVISLVGVDEKAQCNFSDTDTILYLRETIPHCWLFQHISATIHHGGAGTTHMSLSCGLPSLIIPFMADQFFNSDRVFLRKAGPRPIPIRQVNGKNLTDGIHDLVLKNYDLYLMNAKNISDLMKKEDGLGDCIRMIEKELST